MFHLSCIQLPIEGIHIESVWVEPFFMQPEPNQYGWNHFSGNLNLISMGGTILHANRDPFGVSGQDPWMGSRV